MKNMLRLEKRELIKGRLLIGLALLLIVVAILDLCFWGNWDYYWHAFVRENIGKVCFFRSSVDCLVQILIATTVFGLFTLVCFCFLLLLIVKSGLAYIDKYQKGEINRRWS